MGQPALQRVQRSHTRDSAHLPESSTHKVRGCNNRIIGGELRPIDQHDPAGRRHLQRSTQSTWTRSLTVHWTRKGTRLSHLVASSLVVFLLRTDGWKWSHWYGVSISACVHSSLTDTVNTCFQDLTFLVLDKACWLSSASKSGPLARRCYSFTWISRS